MLEKTNLRYPPTEGAWLKYRGSRLEQFKCAVRSVAAESGIPEAFVAGDGCLRLGVGIAFNAGPNRTAAEAWRDEFSVAKSNDGFGAKMFMGTALEAIGMFLYSQEKRIYRPDSLLVDTFMGTEVSEDFPMAVFRDLPLDGLALELPSRTAVGQFICRNYLIVPFDISVDAVEGGPRSLAILGYFGEHLGYKPLTILDLRGGFTLAPTASYSVTGGGREGSGLFLESEVLKLAARAECKALAESLHAPTIQMIHFLLNVVLYLIGENDRTTLVRATRKNLAGKPEAEAKKLRELQAPHVYGFGAKWGRAVQHWIEESSRQGEGGSASSGRSVAPHIRKAHPHLYWTGPGRAIPVVRFLMPVLVKGGAPEVSEGDELPTIHAVH